MQERCKSEEKTSILNQLHHFHQADTAPASASASSPASVTATPPSVGVDSRDSSGDSSGGDEKVASLVPAGAAATAAAGAGAEVVGAPLASPAKAADTPGEGKEEVERGGGETLGE